MFLGIVYLLLSAGLCSAGLGLGNGIMFLGGVGLGFLGWAFLSRARADRQAQRDYQRMMNLIHRL